MKEDDGLKLIKRLQSAALSLLILAYSSPIMPEMLGARAADAEKGDFSVSAEFVKSMQNMLLSRTQDVKVNMDKTMDVNGDGKINAFDLSMMKRKFNEQSVYNGNFYTNSAKTVKTDKISLSAIQADDYSTNRLIVRAKKSYDFTKYSPTKTIVGPDFIYVLQFDNQADAAKCQEALEKDTNIVYAEADKYLSSGDFGADVVSDSHSWGVSDIEADQYAEYLRETSNASVVVAIVDTGIGKHSFLDDRVQDNGYDFIDIDFDPTDANDQKINDHGTHVAGIVVDCTPGLNVSLLPVRVLDVNGQGTDLNVGNGIRYAVDNGANVINLSLGSAGDDSSYIDDCIDYAVGKGVTVVVSAGNNNSSTENACPAHLDNCIVVSACDQESGRASFSNYGKSVDMTAPGVNINSSVLGGKFGNKSGTSMAAPHISAAAAMVLCNHRATPAEVEAMLEKSCKDLGESGKDVYYGYGIPKLSYFVENVSPAVKLSETSLSMNPDESVTLTALTIPSGRTVTWSTSNAKVATVSEGKVVAVGKGEAVITAYLVYKSETYKAECKVSVAGTDTVTVTLDPVDGKVSATELSVTVGEPYGTLPVPSKTGYIFDGWFNGEKEYTEDTIVEIKRNHTLTAKWTPIMYHISYQANGGTGTMESTLMTYNEVGNLSANTFKREGYTFAGWATSENGTVKYKDKEQVINLSSKYKSTVKLYAVWNVSSYTVAFHPSGGSGTMQSVDFAYDEEKQLPVNAFTKSGYSFVGWSDTAGGSVKYTDGQTVSKLTKENGAIVTLYAVWYADTYTVKYNANGGSGTMNDSSLEYGSSVYLPSNTFKKTGYSFAGWALSSTGTVQYTDGQLVKDICSRSQTSVTLYAKWTANTYTVSFNANGGSVSTTSKTVSYGSTYGTLPTPTRTYYTFDGWYTATSGGTKIISTSTVNITSNQTLYAHWTLNGFGSWSSWSTTPVTENENRKVETRQAASKYNLVTICCGNSSGYRCYLPYMQSGYTKRAEPYTASVSADVFATMKAYAPGTYFDLPDSNNCDGYIIGPGNAYVEPGGYTPWYVSSIDYVTQYRYCDRIQ